MSLTEARYKRAQAGKLLSNNVDLGVVKHAAKNAVMTANDNSFHGVELDWFGKFSTKWIASQGDGRLRHLERYFPWIGNCLMKIKASELLIVLRRIKN